MYGPLCQGTMYFYKAPSKFKTKTTKQNKKLQNLREEKGGKIAEDSIL